MKTNPLGLNSIPVYIRKILKPFFSLWQSKLINASCEVAIFSDLLRNFTYTQEKWQVMTRKHYRPISLLSTLNKIYKKVWYTRIYSHLTK